MKRIDSETTTSLVETHSRIGTLRGELGSATPENIQAAAWLARQRPMAVNRELQSRASRHGVELRPKTEGRYPTGANGEQLMSYTETVGCDIDGPQEGRDAALQATYRMMTPAPQREIEGWLAELSVIVAKRPSGEVDEMLRLEAYAGRLRQYPADIARHALLGETWKFWPSWSELEAVCRKHTGAREHMLHALSLPAPEPEQPQPEIDPVEQERFKQWREAQVASLRRRKEAGQERERVRHWSETAGPDDPRWEELKRARKATQGAKA